MSTKKEVSEDSTLVLQALKEKYFREALKENRPHTPEITERLDKLEKTIREVADREKEAA